jgi:UDP-glucose 4-epimerase
VVRALVELPRHPAAAGQIFNVGSTEEITIAELARRVKTAAASASAVRCIPYAQVYDASFEDMRRRVPDIGKIRSLIGWQPTRSLAEILQGMVAEQRGVGAA